MKILTVRNPWAWLIINGGKDIENRSTNIAGSYRGPVAIHSSIKNHKDSWETFLVSHPRGEEMKAKMLNSLVYGSIVGVVDLVDVHECFGNESACFSRNKGEKCSEWALISERFHLVLRNPRAINPIPYKGFLGLRTIKEPEILREIEKLLLSGN